MALIPPPPTHTRAGGKLVVVQIEKRGMLENVRAGDVMVSINGRQVPEATRVLSALAIRPVCIGFCREVRTRWLASRRQRVSQ